ncbi:host specificity factor TipJ family phage tail protein [Metapseudomonas furukawaii]
MIALYRDKLKGELWREYRVIAPVTIERWLMDHTQRYERREVPPISVEVNGKLVDGKLWPSYEVQPDDDVAIWLEPKGTDPFTITIAAIAGLQAVMKLFMPRISLPKSRGAQSGAPLSTSTVKANQVKFGDVIREVAGEDEIFPDYIVPPRAWFKDKRSVWMQALLCIGKGEFEISPSDIKIGDTPIISLGSNARYAIFGPGQSVAGDIASVWWHTVDEVGATSTGTAGIDLRTTTTAAQSASAEAYQFNDDLISVPTGAGQFPASWAAGMIIRIEVEYQYTVTAGNGVGGRDTIAGPLAQLGPFVGMKIEVRGANAGLYVVHGYTAGAAGTASTYTGSAAPARYNFNTTPLTFNIVTAAGSWIINLTTNVTNLAGLLAEINSQLGSAPINAVDSSGRVRLVEEAPFRGQAIVVSNSPDIFGAAPVSVTGTATSPDTMTLNTTSGAPVMGLQTGTGWATIGYQGLRYRLTAASTSAISVERLTDTGATDGAWPGFDFMESNSAALTLDSSTLEGDWAGPFAACPEGELATAFEYDVFAPGGLCGVDKKGRKYAIGATYEVQYRDMALAGAWTAVTETLSDATLDQLGYTRSVTLPYAMRPEVRMRRIGAKSDNPSEQNGLQWYGLRGRLPSPSAYQGVTCIAIEIATGGKLAAQSENQVSVTATRKLPTRSAGAWTAPQATRDIVPWVAHIAKSVGYTDADLDLEEFDVLDAMWKSRGDTFDLSVESSSTVKNCMNDALRAGFAELTISRGLLRPVRDQLREGVDHNYVGPAADGEVWAYSAQNMIGELDRQFSTPDPNEPDGIDVEYKDRNTRQMETVKCRAPGDLGKKIEKLTAVGISDRNRAYRLGMRRRMEQIYRRWTYGIETELDANNSEYMSLAGASDDTPGSGQSAYLKSTYAMGAQTVLVVSETFDWSAITQHVVAVRRPDGTISGPYSATRSADDQVAIPGTLDFTPDLSGDRPAPDVLFGRIHPVIVTSVDPKGLESVSLRGVNYHENVYLYDDATADN